MLRGRAKANSLSVINNAFENISSTRHVRPACSRDSQTALDPIVCRSDVFARRDDAYGAVVADSAPSADTPGARECAATRLRSTGSNRRRKKQPQPRISIFVSARDGLLKRRQPKLVLPRRTRTAIYTLHWPLMSTRKWELPANSCRIPPLCRLWPFEQMPRNSGHQVVPARRTLSLALLKSWDYGLPLRSVIVNEVVEISHALGILKAMQICCMDAFHEALAYWSLVGAFSRLNNADSRTSGNWKIRWTSKPHRFVEPNLRSHRNAGSENRHPPLRQLMKDGSSLIFRSKWSAHYLLACGVR